MARILYISYDGMTDSLGQSQVIPYLRELSRMGHSFELVSAEKPERFKRGKQHIQQLCDEAGVRWHPLLYTKKPPVFSTWKDLRKIIRMGRSILRKEEFDIIHCRGHYITSLAGQSLRKEFPSLKYVFDMRGFWADERIDGGLWNMGNALYRTIYNFFKRKEAEFLSEADHIVSLTEAGRQVIHSWEHIPAQPRPVTVIPCCADMELFNSASVSDADVRSLRDSLALSPGSRVLLYLGSIGTWYMLDEMLDFFARLQRRHPQWVFLFLTSEDASHIRKAAAKRGIPDSAILVRTAARSTVPHYIALADLGIFFIKPLFSKKGSSPTKQGEMMGMGLPIICNDGVGDTAEIVREANGGAVIGEFTDAAYDEVISRLDELSRLDKAHIRECALRYFDLEAGSKRFNDIYRQILQGDN